MADFEKAYKYMDDRPKKKIVRSGNMRPGYLERFWSKVDKGDGDSCWIWTAGRDRLGYGQVLWKGVCRKAYSVAWEIANGYRSMGRGIDLDHICCNPSCVRPDHLRLCLHSDNVKNCRIRSDNKTGFKGVIVVGRRKDRYRAHIRVNGKRIVLGEYRTPEEAHEAYRIAAVKYHGEFANFGGKRE